MLNTAKIKQQFAMYTNHPDLVYLDNAATSLTPDIVIDAMNGYYRHYNANIHRGGHGIGARATEQYEQVRSQVASFLHAPSEQNIVFTSGTTHGINMLAQGLKHTLEQGDVILLTSMEHHANILPWQRIAKETGAELRYVPVTEDFCLDMRAFDEMCDERVKIVSVSHVSNVLGAVNDIAYICKKAKEQFAYCIVDAAQSVSHMQLDVQQIGCDALVFSGHKMYGPTGVGVLYGTTELLKELTPYHLGGGIVNRVREDDAEWNDIPARFEAGTPHIAGVVGLGAAIEFLQHIGFEDIAAHEHALAVYAYEQLSAMEQVKLFTAKEHVSSVISFVVEGIHHYDIAAFLDKEHIAIRTGKHCAEPLIMNLGVSGTCRLSCGLYNTTVDIDRFVSTLQKAITVITTS